MSEISAGLGDLEGDLAALAHLEAALVEHVYGNPGGAGEHLASAQEQLGFAAELTGLQPLASLVQKGIQIDSLCDCQQVTAKKFLYCLTSLDAGALGMRTVHQADPKAQLIVKFVGKSAGHSEPGEPTAALDAPTGGSPDTSEESVSDVLESVKLIEESGKSNL